MTPITIELPIRPSYHAFNRERWLEILHDPDLLKCQGKIETNRHGTVLMMPPASGSHSRYQGKILILLSRQPGGEAMPECPISTCDGVRAADVGWYSRDRLSTVEDQPVFEIAPEICVEVLSPSNSPSEMDEKKQLYFEAGAQEVWFCSDIGAMTFFTREAPDVPRPASRLRPDFPVRID